MIADEEETQLYGLDKELAEKLAAKYDPKREAEARQYIEELAETPFPSDSFHESLKDGVILCKAVNKILRDIGERDQIKVVVSKMPFKQVCCVCVLFDMENVGNFLAQMERIGVPAHERFLTVDLYEAKDLNQVVNSIFSLSRHAAKRGFRGPVLGPKLSEKNERTFTDEQLRQAAAMPSKLMSFSSNVSSGLSFSGRREIGGK
ncbi:calponin homology domain-containing protein, partial [Chytriomyces cf. hyalinus JEL632]